NTGPAKGKRKTSYSQFLNSRQRNVSVRPCVWIHTHLKRPRQRVELLPFASALQVLPHLCLGTTLPVILPERNEEQNLQELSHNADKYQIRGCCKEEIDHSIFY
ncbi:leukemia-associated protein 1-like, partial [Aotus nancymaae]